MLKTLEEITSRIARRYDPVSVILFGSRSKEGGNPDGDFDLAIIKETDSRPIDRRVEVEKILADRGMALDIFVYTPAEVLDIYRQGSTFISEIVETGRVLYMRKNTKIWIDDAENEIKSASILLKNGMHKACCFHSQQAAEKLLRALIQAVL